VMDLFTSPLAGEVGSARRAQPGGGAPK